MRQSHIFQLGVRRLTTYEGGPFWAVGSALDFEVFLRSTEAQNAHFTEKVKKIQLSTNLVSNRFTFTADLFGKIQVFMRSTEDQNAHFTEKMKKIQHFTNFVSNQSNVSCDLKTLQFLTEKSCQITLQKHILSKNKISLTSNKNKLLQHLFLTRLKDPLRGSKLLSSDRNLSIVNTNPIFG